MLRSLKKLLFTATTIAFLLLLPLSPVYAADTYFNICLDRSVNIYSPDNSNKISEIGDSVTLNKKGRLWLVGNETKKGFIEIICQNLSNEPVNVALINMESPWLKISSTTECDTWKNNLLICPVGSLDKGVFCKITEKTAVNAEDGANKQMSASVNVRAVTIQDESEKKFDPQQYLKERIDYYGAGIDLCNTMYVKNDKVLISWIIYSGGTVDKVQIDSNVAPEDQEVAKCIADQIASWKFPEWDRNTQISYQF